jgi:hypothetical protein
MEQGDIHGGAYKRLDMGKNEDEVRMRPDKKKKKKMTYDEIKAEREKNEEFMTGKSPGEDTWGLCVVLRKD